MDATKKAKLLQQRRDYKRARAVDSSNRSCPTLPDEQNDSRMLQTHVKPMCTDANDVEFDAALFEPAGIDSDDEGWFYNSDYQCNDSFVGI